MQVQKGHSYMGVLSRLEEQMEKPYYTEDDEGYDITMLKCPFCGGTTELNIPDESVPEHLCVLCNHFTEVDTNGIWNV